VSALEAALRQISIDLTDAGVRFALIGGLAVSVRTEPRFTRDADLAVALPSDVEAEALIRTLQTSGYGIEAIIEQRLSAGWPPPGSSASPSPSPR